MLKDVSVEVWVTHNASAHPLGPVALMTVLGGAGKVPMHSSRASLKPDA